MSSNDSSSIWKLLPPNKRPLCLLVHKTQVSGDSGLDLNAQLNNKILYETWHDTYLDCMKVFDSTVIIQKCRLEKT